MLLGYLTSASWHHVNVNFGDMHAERFGKCLLLLYLVMPTSPRCAMLIIYCKSAIFFFSRVHISDFQNPSGLTKLFMIILILVLKFLFKFHPVVFVATELNEKLFLIYSNEQLILLLKCLTTVAVLSNMTKLAGIFLMTDCQF